MDNTLIASVVDGKLNDTSISSTGTKSVGSKLGKDSFLQLLCTQMQYQDPLNPQSDTEFVAQLAQFSALEEMQNLTSVNRNSQALSLVGQNVQIKTATGADGKDITFSGIVDYVFFERGVAKLSINGKAYSMDDLQQVIDPRYLIQKNLPSIDKEASFAFDANEPKDFTFDVNFGKEDTVANQVLIAIDGSIVDSKYVTLSDGKITISKDYFNTLPNGEYPVAVVFNDPYTTTVTNKVSVSVKNSTVQKGDKKTDTTDTTDKTDATTEKKSPVSEEAINELVRDRQEQ